MSISHHSHSGCTCLLSTYDLLHFVSSFVEMTLGSCGHLEWKVTPSSGHLFWMVPPGDAGVCRSQTHSVSLAGHTGKGTSGLSSCTRFTPVLIPSPKAVPWDYLSELCQGRSDQRDSALLQIAQCCVLLCCETSGNMQHQICVQLSTDPARGTKLWRTRDLLQSCAAQDAPVWDRVGVLLETLAGLVLAPVL